MKNALESRKGMYIWINWLNFTYELQWLAVAYRVIPFLWIFPPCSCLPGWLLFSSCTRLQLIRPFIVKLISPANLEEKKQTSTHLKAFQRAGRNVEKRSVQALLHIPKLFQSESAQLCSSKCHRKAGGAAGPWQRVRNSQGELSGWVNCAVTEFTAVSDTIQKTTGWCSTKLQNGKYSWRTGSNEWGMRRRIS